MKRLWTKYANFSRALLEAAHTAPHTPVARAAAAGVNRAAHTAPQKAVSGVRSIAGARSPAALPPIPAAARQPPPIPEAARRPPVLEGPATFSRHLNWAAHEAPHVPMRPAAPLAPVLPGGKMAPGTAVKLSAAQAHKIAGFQRYVLPWMKLALSADEMSGILRQQAAAVPPPVPAHARRPAPQTIAETPWDEVERAKNEYRAKGYAVNPAQAAAPAAPAAVSRRTPTEVIDQAPPTPAVQAQRGPITQVGEAPPPVAPSAIAPHAVAPPPAVQAPQAPPVAAPTAQPGARPPSTQAMGQMNTPSPLQAPSAQPLPDYKQRQATVQEYRKRQAEHGRQLEARMAAQGQGAGRPSPQAAHALSNTSPEHAAVPAQRASAAPRIDPRVSAHDAAEAHGMQATHQSHAAIDQHLAPIQPRQGAQISPIAAPTEGALRSQAFNAAEHGRMGGGAAAAHAGQAAHAVSDAAHAVKPSFLSRNKGRLGLAAGGAALLGLGGYAASRAGAEQDVRIRDYMQNAQRDGGTPMPYMAVHASYDNFAERAKLGELQPMYPTVQGALANSMATQLATKFIGEPIDAAHKALKKKFYDDPKHQASFDEAVSGDELLREAHAANPTHLADSFSTLKKFAPSMAAHPQATRSFLRQAHMAGTHGSGMDFATIRMLAETEKFIQNSKGQGRQ